MNISIQELVRRDLLHREQMGIEQYGTSLQPFNGRAALLDAYEEVLDLAVYLRQALTEHGIDPRRPNPPPQPMNLDTRLRMPNCGCADVPEYGQ